MKTKIKGKIVQIVPEEKSKSMGFLKYENSDYLNMRPFEERLPKKNIKKLMFAFFILFFILLFTVSPTGGWAWLVFFSLIGAGGCMIYNDNYVDKYTKNKYWYFDAPFPVEKPHNFKVGDVVNMTVEVEKENE